MCLVKWLSKIWHRHMVEYSLVIKYNKFVLTERSKKMYSEEKWKWWICYDICGDFN